MSTALQDVMCYTKLHFQLLECSGSVYVPSAGQVLSAGTAADLSQIHQARFLAFRAASRWLWDKLRDILFTYFLTPWSRVLLEKLTGPQLVKKFPALYGTRRFITAFTSVRQLSLS